MVKIINPHLGECGEMLISWLLCSTVVTLYAIVLHLQYARIWCLCECAYYWHSVVVTCIMFLPLYGPQREYILASFIHGSAPPSRVPRPMLLIRNEKPVLSERLILCQHDTFTNTLGHNLLRAIALLSIAWCPKHIQWLL